MMDWSPGVSRPGLRWTSGRLGCGPASRMGARPILFSLSPVYGTVAPRNQIASPGQIRNCPEGKVRTRAYGGEMDCHGGDRPKRPAGPWRAQAAEAEYHQGQDYRAAAPEVPIDPNALRPSRCRRPTRPQCTCGRLSNLDERLRLSAVGGKLAISGGPSRRANL